MINRRLKSEFSRFTSFSTKGKTLFLGTALVLGTCLSAAIYTSTKVATPAVQGVVTHREQPVAQEQVKKPIIEVKTLTQTEVLPFTTEETTDSNLEKDKTKVTQEGKEGTKEIKFEVTYQDGKEISRKKTSETVINSPVNKVVATGTYVPIIATKPKVTPAAPKPTPVVTPPSTSSCDPNYSRACVPIASDVDCAGGSGNGPSYVKGPVYVIGTDIYKLDSDGDGVGCEN